MWHSDSNTSSLLRSIWNSGCPPRRILSELVEDSAAIISWVSNRERDSWKTEYVYVRVMESARLALEVLSEDLPRIIAKISFPKSMRWNSQVCINLTYYFNFIWMDELETRSRFLKHIHALPIEWLGEDKLMFSCKGDVEFVGFLEDLCWVVCRGVWKKSFSVDQLMRRVMFSRPIRWILALHGDVVVPFMFAGVLRRTHRLIVFFRDVMGERILMNHSWPPLQDLKKKGMENISSPSFTFSSSTSPNSKHPFSLLDIDLDIPIALRKGVRTCT
ncbi:Glycine--tRNA ligase, chloroplastic/mitochondrial 2 [Vitis vinifera]|uniref:glycine--tRNA ligase n=1 Tax=Vitis vinifera TaxID=29760 RepID=A0A438FUT1_VITVI|nr:Glycine--tRNA ligase, chloroplastic/mitochondrial 2 [Vitis vinifera]